jgi:hypothetical protein
LASAQFRFDTPQLAAGSFIRFFQDFGPIIGLEPNNYNVLM